MAHFIREENYQSAIPYWADVKNSFVLGLYVKSSRLLGILPWHCRASPNFKHLSMVYIFLVVSIESAAVFYFGMLQRNVYGKDALNPFELFLTTLRMVCEISILLAILFVNIKERKSIRNVLIYLERNKTSSLEKDVGRRRETKHLIPCIISHFTIPILYLYELVFWSIRDLHTLKILLQLAPDIIVLLYQTVLTGFLWEICSALAYRYGYVKKYLEKSMGNGMILMENTNKLQNVLLMYRNLYWSTEDINKIFGPLVMTISAHCVIFFVNLSNVILCNLGKDININPPIYLIIITVSI